MTTTTKTYSTRELHDKRVVGGKSGEKRIGKVRRFVFHPNAKRCVGFIVKRPDALLMFRRADLFVPYDGFSIEDGRVALPADAESGKEAIKRLGLDWDACVMWEGMPLVTESGETLGTVGDIVFSQATGKVISVAVEKGATNKALLGQTVIPAKLVLGFRTGIGVELASEYTQGAEEEDPVLGAIVVSDEAAALQGEGGIAQRAGQGAAKAQDAVERTVKPKAQAAGKAAGKAVEAGAFATGRQIGRAKGMFSAFKEEYDKASGADGRKAKQRKK